MWRGSRLGSLQEIIVDGLPHLKASVAPEVHHVPPLQLLPVLPSVGPGLLPLLVSVSVSVGGGFLPGPVKGKTWIKGDVIFFC